MDGRAMRTKTHKTVRALLLGAILAVAGGGSAGRASAQSTSDYGLPQGLSFWNEISSGLVEALGRHYNNAGKYYVLQQNYNSEFAGIQEKLAVQYESDKLGFLLAPELSLVDAGQHWSVYSHEWGSAYHALNQDDLSFAWTGLDWHVRFAPFGFVEANLHRSVRTDGGYLAVIGRWLDEADLQGSGFGLIVSPLEGLRVAAEMPMGFAVACSPNRLDGEVEDSWWPDDPGLYARPGYGGSGSKTFVRPSNGAAEFGYWDESGNYPFVLNAGADYGIGGLVTAGVSVHDMLDKTTRALGVYASARISFLQLRASYTHNGEATRVSLLDFDGMGLERVFIGGRHKAGLAATAELGDWRLSADALWNVRKKQSVYDLYAGLRADYAILPGKLGLSLAAALVLDFGNERDGGIGYARTREKGRHDLPMYTTGTYWFHPKKGSGDRSKNERQAEMAAPMLEFRPSLTYVTGRNTFTAGVEMQCWPDGEASWAAGFPVSWRVSF